MVRARAVLGWRAEVRACPSALTAGALQWVLAFELFIPLVLFFILLGLRQKKPTISVKEGEGRRAPAPGPRARCRHSPGSPVLSLPRMVARRSVCMQCVSEHCPLAGPSAVPARAHSLPRSPRGGGREGVCGAGCLLSS